MKGQKDFSYYTAIAAIVSHLLAFAAIYFDWFGISTGVGGDFSPWHADRNITCRKRSCGYRI